MVQHFSCKQVTCKCKDLHALGKQPGCCMHVRTNLFWYVRRRTHSTTCWLSPILVCLLALSRSDRHGLVCCFMQGWLRCAVLCCAVLCCALLCLRHYCCRCSTTTYSHILQGWLLCCAALAWRVIGFQPSTRMISDSESCDLSPYLLSAIIDVTTSSNLTARAWGTFARLGSIFEGRAVNRGRASSGCVLRLVNHN